MSGSTRRALGAIEGFLLLFSLGWLLAVPSTVALAGPLASNGTPPRLAGLLFALVALLEVVRRLTEGGPRPPADRVVMVTVLVAIQSLFSAVMFATTGPSTTAQAASLRTVLIGVSGFGLVAAIARLLPSSLGRQTIMLLLVVGGSVSAVVGLLQAGHVIGHYSDLFSLPGLQHVTEGVIKVERSGISRVLGSAGHPIEFSLVLVACLPLSLHLATHGSAPYVRRTAYFCTALILVGLPFGLSRTGLIALLVVGVFYLPTLGRRAVVLGMTTVVGGIFVLVMTAPGYAGAIASSIMNSSSDNSIAGRLADYPVVLKSFDAHPLLGAYIPLRGLILDNAWLGRLADSGIVGVTCLALLFLVPIYSAVQVARRSRVLATRSESMAVAVSLSVFAFGCFTYDLFDFGQSALLVYVIIGLIAALRVTSRTPPPVDNRPEVVRDESIVGRP